MSPITKSEPKYDLVSPQFFADPHAVFRRMRAEDPVYWHPTMKMWFLVRYADVQQLARDPRFTAMRADHYGRDAPSSVQAKLEVVNRFLSSWLVFIDPPGHTRLRSLISKAFTSRSVEALRPFVQKVVNERIDAVRPCGAMEIIEQIALPLPAAVISKMLGMPDADFPRFKGWTEDVFALLGAAVATVETVERGYRGAEGLDGYLRGAIELRRSQPSDDLLSMLAQAEVQGQVLNDEEIVATCALLMVAGYETTTNLISNGLLALFEHPDQLHKLRDDPSLVTGAVEEFLRYNSAAFQLIRRAREQVEIDGHVIQAGDIVFGLLHAANRDPAQFADAERLDITRKDNYHLGFGFGPHICVGASIARLEIQIAINTLVQSLPDLALASTAIEWSSNLALRGMRTLPVTFRA